MRHEIVSRRVGRFGALSNDRRHFGEVGRVRETRRFMRLHCLFPGFVGPNGFLDVYDQTHRRKRLGFRRSVGAQYLYIAMLISVRIEAGQ
jgi:hypothetical protein